MKSRSIPLLSFTSVSNMSTQAFHSSYLYIHMRCAFETAFTSSSLARSDPRHYYPYAASPSLHCLIHFPWMSSSKAFQLYYDLVLVCFFSLSSHHICRELLPPSMVILDFSFLLACSLFPHSLCLFPISRGCSYLAFRIQGIQLFHRSLFKNSISHPYFLAHCCYIKPLLKFPSAVC